MQMIYKNQETLLSFGPTIPIACTTKVTKGTPAHDTGMPNHSQTLVKEIRQGRTLIAHNRVTSPSEVESESLRLACPPF